MVLITLKIRNFSSDYTSLLPIPRRESLSASLVACLMGGLFLHFLVKSVCRDTAISIVDTVTIYASLIYIILELAYACASCIVVTH